MGFLTFLKNLFQRGPKDEAHSLVQFPPTVYTQPQPPPVPPSRPAIPSAVTHPHPRPLPPPPPRSEEESSTIPSAVAQTHRHKPPPIAPPIITIIPPSPAIIPVQERLRQEELVSSQTQIPYPPELRRQVDEVVDTMYSEERSEYNMPNEPVPPYTPFDSRPFTAAADLVYAPPRVGISRQAGHNVQPHAFIPVHPANPYHPSYVSYQEANHHMYLHNAHPQHRSSRTPHRREQAIQYRSPEASGRHLRNAPAYSRHPM